MSALNSIELFAMNNPVRRFVQRRVELPAFERALTRGGIDLTGARILDAGCGSGYSTALLAERFRPSRLEAFDLMPEQVERARARAIPGARIERGDVTVLAYDDASFDAAFVFGILHHVPAWRTALCELARVLRPGGALSVEELRGGYIRWQDRLLLTRHPREAAFEWPELRDGLGAAGFRIESEHALAPGIARGWLAIRR